ncbi:MAG: MBL fold metallo-hydrolase [Burkholderiaceae bacterium]|nr:MBL fold metallo-hydrolase [Burkholderiaceae bacterium]
MDAARRAARIEHCGHGVFAVDSGYVRPGFDAIHLIVEAGRAAIVDTGTSHSVPRVLAALDALGVAPGCVDFVVLTHVHLDHAGGAGALMRALPEARLTVHPRGARHMIDPTRLWQATCAVYGREAAEALYGEIVPIDPQRVLETGDGASVTVAGRTLEFLDTPGHARHHVTIRDSATGHLFAGDTFGVSYRELDVAGRPFVFPSSTPVQFDPDALQRSLARLLALAPEAVYLTHYSKRGDVARLGADQQALIERYAQIALSHADAGDARRSGIAAELRALLLGAARAHGVTLDDARILALIGADIELNADGLVDWLDARERSKPDAHASEPQRPRARSTTPANAHGATR